MDPRRPQSEDAAVTAAAEALTAAFAGEGLDTNVRARHLYRLREHAAGMPVPATTRTMPVRRGWLAGLRQRVAVAAATSGVVLTLGSGVAVAASADALPGDRLYQVKQVVEQVQVQVAGVFSETVPVLLDHAERRLDETEALLAQDADGELVAGALIAHAQLLNEAAAAAEGDVELESMVAAATAVAQARLEQLLASGLPEQAAGPARAALDNARQILGVDVPTTAPPTETDEAPPADLAPARPPAAPGDSWREQGEDRGEEGRQRGEDQRPDDPGTADEGESPDTAPSGPPEQAPVPEPGAGAPDEVPAPAAGPHEQAPAPDDQGPPADGQDAGVPDDPQPPQEAPASDEFGVRGQGASRVQD